MSYAERGGAQRSGVKFFSVLLAATLVLPLQAFAVDGELVNENTGSDSTNSNDVTHTRDVLMTFTNTGTVTNTFDLTLNTGGNTITDNTEVGDITTGSVDVAIEAENDINNADLSLAEQLEATSQASGMITSINSNTGAGSTNSNDVTVNQTQTVTVNNTLTATNTVTLDANTGNNAITDNTVVGDITTGNINVVVAFSTIGNQGGGNLPDTSGGDGNGGGGGSTFDGSGADASTSSSSPVTIAQAQSVPTNPIAQIAKGGGQFFPAGSSPDLIYELFVATLLAIGLLRFSHSFRFLKLLTLATALRYTLATQAI